MTDPSGKHEQRYWSGTEWTDHVMNGGTPGVDALPARTKPRDDGPSAESDVPPQSSNEEPPVTPEEPLDPE
jgi:hypothetical protein